MTLRARSSLAAAVAAALLLPAGASAGTLETIPIPTAGATNGIAQAPDGSMLVAVQRYGSGGDPSPSTVARIAPDGSVTQSAALGGLPVSVAIVGGKAWVSLTGLKRIAVLDPATLAPLSSIPMAAGHCGPVGIADGGNGKAYVSLPQDDAATCTSEIAVVNYGNGSNALTYRAGKGQAYALAIASGSLFVPDSAGDVVRRLTLDAADTLPQTAIYGAPSGASPDGIAVAPDGSIVTSYFGSGAIGQTAATAGSGNLATLGTGLKSPFGLASVGGSLYVASSALGGGGTPSIVRYRGMTPTTIAVPAGAAPWDVAAGPDGTAYFTDQSFGRVLRYTSRAPRATTGGATLTSATAATLAGTTNPGGNDTSLKLEYGTSTSYGQQAAAGSASGVADGTATAAVTGLAAATTYHYRLVATSEEGTVDGDDRTFATPAAPVIPAPVQQLPAPTPKPTAKTLLSLAKLPRSIRAGTTLKLRVKLTNGTGTVTATLTHGKTRLAKATRPKSRGTVTISLRLSRKARRGKATLTIKAPGATTIVRTITVTRPK